MTFIRRKSYTPYFLLMLYISREKKNKNTKDKEILSIRRNENIYVDNRLPNDKLTGVFRHERKIYLTTGVGTIRTPLSVFSCFFGWVLKIVIFGGIRDLCDRYNAAFRQNVNYFLFWQSRINSQHRNQHYKKLHITECYKLSNEWYISKYH